MYELGTGTRHCGMFGTPTKNTPDTYRYTLPNTPLLRNIYWRKFLAKATVPYNTDDTVNEITHPLGWISEPVFFKNQGGAHTHTKLAALRTYRRYIPTDRRVARCLHSPRRRKTPLRNPPEGVCYLITRVISGTYLTYHTPSIVLGTCFCIPGMYVALWCLVAVC